MVDLNNTDYLKTLSDAAKSEYGKIIVEFLKAETTKIKFEDIDDKLPFDQIGLEYKVLKKVRQLFKKCLIYLK